MALTERDMELVKLAAKEAAREVLADRATLLAAPRSWGFVDVDS